jgi:1,2-diacylglycerol 3-alpha-glucosyltransferase/glucuronosyltransferase
MDPHPILRDANRARLVLLATDCWNQTNGITTLYRAVIRCLDERFRGSCRLLIVHPTDHACEQSIGDGHHVIGMAPRFRFHLPQYPELVTGYVRHQDFRDLEAVYGRVDVVHVATQGFLGLSATRYAARYRKPCVGFYHTNWPAYVSEYLPSVLPWRLKAAAARVIARRWDRLIYGQCSVLIAHTARTEQCLSSVLKRKLLYASGFVDVRRFATAGGTRSGDQDAEPVVFGFVGRIAKEKHLSRILNHADAIARLGCRLIVVGDGPERRRLASAGAEFVGYKHGDDLVAMYRSLHFLLIPTRSDTLGLVLLEAAACGTPAVALRGTVAADLISRYGSGVVVDDFDDGLFRYLHDVARSDRFKDMRARAKAMAADHDVALGTAILVKTWLDAPAIALPPNQFWADFTTNSASWRRPPDRTSGARRQTVFAIDVGDGRTPRACSFAPLSSSGYRAARRR